MTAQGHQRRIRDVSAGSAHPPIAADLVHRDERSRWATNGHRARQSAVSRLEIVIPEDYGAVAFCCLPASQCSADWAAEDTAAS
jgi:hypothetical protein